MRKTKLFIAGVLCALAACNNPGDKIGDTGSNTTDTLSNSSGVSSSYDTTLTGCYSSISKRDTAALQIETKGAVIAGPLTYSIFEKDRNVGEFQGEVRGDILSGWYLFKSEGTMSVRQAAWKISGTSLWPAIGDVIQKGDTALFKDESKLRFDSINVFKKVPCTL
ncbi:hypothetical protein LZZ85_06585 [Terrimonas sp. NA20]|uniref:Lipoprotein n=1 Tax=Terrimonas ginsenosidimutans TaxID=2908004 RepID=A0ABS9KNP4_9BACT|nr:hypothetical protein [Terrimonas ginsenosidimutans]MCG2613939.1 hypothetical protein [Terrimonas ginsenosidimutans]